MKNKRVCFIIPPVGTEEDIEFTLKSLCSQTYREIEIICMDNCKDPAYSKTILSFSEQFETIRIEKLSKG